MIYLKNVGKVYDDFQALSGIDLSIFQGEFVMLLGPSGCGKSTLLNIIGLMDSLSSGTYKLDSVEVSHLTFSEKAMIRNQSIGFVFQTFYLLNHLSIEDNVALPLGYQGMDKVERRQLAKDELISVGLADKCLDYPTQLSGGQKQRVAIARAIVTKPKILIADEPTGNLDSENGRNIMRIFKSLHEKGHTIIMSTHNEALVEYATRVIRIKDGQLVE